MIKAISSISLAVVSCFLGLFSSVEIRLNPEKYNYITVDVADVPSPVEKLEKDDYVQLSDIKMHYQVYGNGSVPMILIHGNGGGVGNLHDVATLFANDYTVYVIESRCHGYSTDPGVITYDLMAKDVYEFSQALKIKKPIILGHSDGAIVGLSAASLYPDFPGAVIACGANSHPETAWFQFRFWVHWENLLEKDKLNDLMLDGPYFTEEYLSKITCPTYIVSGDHDLMPVSDTLYMHNNIKNSDIAVIKGADHSSYIDDESQVYSLSSQWLNKKFDK